MKSLPSAITGDNELTLQVHGGRLLPLGGRWSLRIAGGCERSFSAYKTIPEGFSRKF
jgi:hypothetical protein